MKNKGILLVLGTAVISGVSIFINQFGVKVVNPYIFTGFKNVVVVLFLVGIILLMKEFKNFRKLQRRDWLRLLLIGVIGGGIPFLMFFKGLSMSTGPEASYIHKFLFIFIAILAPVFLKEKLKWHYLIGLVFLLIGSVLLFQVNGSLSWGKGDALILGATLLWAIENMISKRTIKTISPRIVAWGRMAFGSLVIMIFWAITGQAASLLTLNLSQIGWVLLTALLLCGYVLTWYSGLKYIPLTYAAGILALGAPITSLLQLIQGKVFVAEQIWGISLMFLGMIIFVTIDKFGSDYFKGKLCLH